MSTIRRTTALAAAAALALAALASTTTPAAATGPAPVDPTTVTPALNPDFAPWDCWRAGTGIICQGDYAPTYENEPIGLLCDGQEVYLSGSGREQMTRWHTADGLATKTVVNLQYPGDTFSLSPTGEGPTVTISGRWNRLYTYAVPGDRSSRTLTEVGAIYLGGRPGDQLLGTGLVRFAQGEDFETVAVAHGTIASLDDETIDAWICGGLT